MKTNLKDNIWIKGFDTNEEVYNFKDTICFVGEKLPYIYIGKTSEIPEEITKKYFDYGYDNLEVHYTSINEAIKESCDQEYCIIYKTK